MMYTHIFIEVYYYKQHSHSHLLYFLYICTYICRWADEFEFSRLFLGILRHMLSGKRQRKGIDLYMLMSYTCDLGKI